MIVIIQLGDEFIVACSRYTSHYGINGEKCMITDITDHFVVVLTINKKVAFLNPNTELRVINSNEEDRGGFYCQCDNCKSE